MFYTHPILALILAWITCNALVGVWMILRGYNREGEKK